VKAASNWVATIEDDKARKQAYGRVAREYLEYNTEEASIWIASLEPSPERDSSVRQLVDEIYRSDPDAAFQWAITVDNINERRNLARQTLEHLKSNGQKDEARKLIVSSSLNAEDRAILNKLLD
jgi:hypothetical protein